MIWFSLLAIARRFAASKEFFSLLSGRSRGFTLSIERGSTVIKRSAGRRFSLSMRARCPASLVRYSALSRCSSTGLHGLAK
jgi:hypothetical protein